MEVIIPIFTDDKMDIAEPTRAKLRIDRELAKLNRSRTLIHDPNLVAHKSEIPDPALTKLRILKLEAQ
jgi:hypothetical protein